MVAILSAFVFAAGSALVVYGLFLRHRSRAKLLRQLLDVELADPSVPPQGLSELMEKAGAFAERALGRTSWGGKVRTLLSQAAWSLKPGEFAAIVSAGALTGAALAYSLAQSPMLALLTACGVTAGSGLLLGRKARRRVRLIEQELPSTLQLLATSLDSGSSVLNAMRLVAEEGSPPLSTELSRVVAESAVGRPLIDGLEAMAQRIGSRDMEWTVEAIRIQTQTGGRLADTLRVLADFMRSRQEVKGEVRALSAEARLSAKVLTALPFLLAAYLFAFRRSYLEPLFESSVGKMMLGVAAAGILLGSIWMRRLVKVDV